MTHLTQIHPVVVPAPLGGSSRTLHLIDADNLAATPDPSDIEARAVRDRYRASVPIATNDHVVLATTHHSAPAHWFAWPPGVRRLPPRSGFDAADHALLEVLEREDVANRYDHVVIGSGDGIFAMPMARLQSAGTRVTVVSPYGGLSRQLRLAVRDARYIHAPGDRGTDRRVAA